ncbi:hypothetical protein HJC23_004331 [Cyclotella cryptica]|uniref:Uncharacterized protein n=1 Tax=Cyclotella cryptica TaxID=29204 RepID=A0ABD3Q4Z7_9STRA|eukprot:CCRYP_008939-RA/>CCRYP_008939-RA protein AED:0.43 eAED:0.41 QI:0/-1/0/1/-1/1/1/0/431
MDFETNYPDTATEKLCQLYGIETLPCKHESTQQASDDDSIATLSLHDRVNSRLVIVRETPSGQVLWKCPVDEVDTIADHLVARNHVRFRLPCYSFRSMLLPMRENERPPVRSSIWLRYCARALFFSAWHIFNQHGNVSMATSRGRFPEMVYCWFSDEEQITNNDDNDKWAFYYGIKLLSNEEAEGWLLYQLLDDTQGEHFLSFSFRTMNVIKKHMGLSWEDQLGLYSRIDAVASKFKFQEAVKGLGRSLDEPVPSLSEAFWLPSERAHAALDDLFYSQLIKTPTEIEELHQNLNELTANLSPPNVELFSFVQLAMKAYLAQMQKHFTLLRLMFDTSSNGTLTDFYEEPRDLPPSTEFDVNPIIGFPELQKIMKTLWPNLSMKEISIVYREAHDIMYPRSQWGKPTIDGISFESFVAAADRRCLFSQIREEH